MAQHPEVLIVGAGPAGIACAIKLARAGVGVLVLEGAEFAGAENWSGAVYHADAWLRDDLIGPDLWRDAPKERRVVARQLFLHDGRSAGGFEARAVAGNDFGEAWTVLRPKMDRWLAARAVDFGATLLTRTTVTGLRYDGGRVIGVNTNRGPVEADCVFLAEGDAAGLVAREGLERNAHPEYAQGIMAVYDLSADEIERRFELRREEGVAQEWLIRNGTLGGKAVRLNATAFLYTNRDSLSVGLVLPLDQLAANGVADHPHLLKRVLSLPGIVPFLDGARQVAFGAKVIRAGGVSETPVWVRDGLAVGGSAVGMGQEIPYPNFIAPAITTGLTFAEAWLKLRARNRSPTRVALKAEYATSLRATDDYRNADLTRHWPHAIHGGPLLFDTLPALVGQLANAESLPPDEARAQRQRAFAIAMRDLRPALNQARGFMRGLYARGAKSHPEVPPLAVRWLIASNGGRPREIEMPDFALLQLLSHAIGHFYGRKLPRYADRMANVWRAPGRVAAALLSVGGIGMLSMRGAFRLLSDLADYRWRRLPLAGLMDRPWHRHERASNAALDWSGAKRKSESSAGWLAPLTRFAPDRRHISVPLEAGMDAARQLRNVCPAEVYSIVSAQGGVASQYENCIKCESCRVTVSGVDWNRTSSHRLAYRAPHDGRYGFDATVHSGLALTAPPAAGVPADAAALRATHDWLHTRPPMVDAQWIAALDSLLAALPPGDFGARLKDFRARQAWGWMECELHTQLSDTDTAHAARAARTVAEHARHTRHHRYAQSLARFDRDRLRQIAAEDWNDADRSAWCAFLAIARPHAAEAVEWLAAKSGALAWLAVNHLYAEDLARRAMDDVMAAPLWREPDGQSNWLPGIATVFVTQRGDAIAVGEAATAPSLARGPRLDPIGEVTAHGMALDGALPVRRATDETVPAFEAQGRLAELRLAMALGELSALRVRAIEYAGSRVQFRGDIKDREGRDGIAKFGAIKNMLATIEHARAMLEAAREDCARAPREVFERIRKHMGPWMDAVPWVAGQIFGGMAFSEEEVFAPRYRDATLLAQWPGMRGHERGPPPGMGATISARPEDAALTGFDRWRQDTCALRPVQIPLVPRRRARGRAMHWNAKEKFAYRSGEFLSGRLLPAGKLLTIEHYRRDPVLRKTRADMLRLLRGGFRSPQQGEPYGRYIDRLHGMPEEDINRLRSFNAFASVVPESLGGRGWNKAQYSILTNELMSRGDVSTGLLVMASTSIGTMPVLLGLDKDLPRLRRELDACLDDAEAWNRLRARLDSLIEMLAHPDPKRFRGAMEALGADIRAMYMQPGSTLKYLARGFLMRMQAAAGIAKARDLDALEPALRGLRDDLDAVRTRFSEERKALDARRDAHARFLQFLATGQISAFALTEPGAGSDTGAIQTRAITREVELVALGDGRYEFIPHGGQERRILADASRFEFANRHAHFRLDNGDQAELDDSDWDMAINRGVRHLKMGDRRLPFHDIGVPVERDGKLLYRYFELSGNKMWITNGSVADRYSFYAQGEEGECGVMLERRSEGLRIGPNENKLGQRASPTNELTLDRVRVDASQLIGFAGHGQVNALETLSVGRGGLVMSCAILVGRLIDDFPAQWAKSPALAASAQAERDCLETLAARLVGLMDRADLDQGDFRIEAAFSKYLASEGAHRVLGWLETLMGPAAAAVEQPLEKWRRDIRILNIYEGTNEVQRFLVLKDLPGLLKETGQPVTDNAALDAALSAFRDFAAPRVKAAGKNLLADPDLQTRFFPVVEWAGELFSWCALHERVRALEEGGDPADRETIARLTALQSSLASRLDDRTRQIREAFRVSDDGGVHPADHGISLARRALAPPGVADETPVRVGALAGTFTCVLRAAMTRRDDRLEFSGWHAPDIAALDRVLDWRDGSPDLSIIVVALAPEGVEDRLRPLQALGITVHHLCCESPSAHATAQWLRAGNAMPNWAVIGAATADARDADFCVELANALQAELIKDVMALGSARRGLWMENANFERHYCHARRPLVFAFDVRASARSDEYTARAWLESLQTPLPVTVPVSAPRTLAVHAVRASPVSDLPERFESPDQLAQWLRARFGAAGAVEQPASIVRGNDALNGTPVWVAAPEELARVRGSPALRLVHDCGPDFSVLTWSQHAGHSPFISRDLNVVGLKGIWHADNIEAATTAAQLAPVLQPILGQSRAVVVGPAQRKLGAALAGRLGIELFDGVLDLSETHVTCARGDYVAEFRRNGPAIYAADSMYRAHALPEGAPEVAMNSVAANDMRPSSLWRFLARAAKPAGLATAPIVVDAGLGVGDAGRFQAWVAPLAARLAEMSGQPVEVGATRRVTQELKLVGTDRQIGQTGVAVAPELLLALGISGAPQHMQWIGKDAIVIAINRDPTAPIFTWHRLNPGPRVIACVGDLENWIPALLNCLKY